MITIINKIIINCAIIVAFINSVHAQNTIAASPLIPVCTTNSCNLLCYGDLNSSAVRSSIGTYCFFAANTAGCTATANRTVTLTPAPTAAISAAMNPLNIFGTTTLTATGGGTYVCTNTAPGAMPGFAFKVNPNNPNITSLAAANRRPIPPAGQPDWFIIESVTPDPTYVRPATCTFAAPDPCGCAGCCFTAFTPTDVAVAVDNYQPEAYPDATLWKMQRELYKKVEAAGGLVQSGSLLDVFRDSIATTTIADLVEVEKDKNEAVKIPSIYLTQLDATKLQYDTYMQQVEAIDTQLETVTDSLQRETLLTQRATLMPILDVLLAQQKVLWQTIEQQAATDIEAVKATNATLVTTNLMEFNEKRINEVYLNTAAKASVDFTAPQIADLATIAHQCPYLGGDAVYVARSLYARFSNDAYNDTEICGAVGIQARLNNANGTKAKTKAAFALAFPNPADDVLHLLTSLPYQDGVLTLTNAIGQRELSLTVRGTMNDINLAPLSNGIYFLILQKEGQPTFQQKVVVAH